METMTAGDVEGVDLMGVMQLETHPYPLVLIAHVTLFFKKIGFSDFTNGYVGHSLSLASFS